MKIREKVKKAFESDQAIIAKLRDAGIPCLLDCPKCGEPHIDKPQPEKGWTNPLHRTHECQQCGHLWRPYDVATYGVENPLRGEIQEAQAGAFEQGQDHARDGDQTVYDHFDSETAEDPVCKIRWFEDRGDPSVGIPGLYMWMLTEDQSGTQLAQLRARVAELESEHKLLADQVVSESNRNYSVGRRHGHEEKQEEINGLVAQLQELKRELIQIKRT